ncbi:MAG: exodeoxyribonuclease VII small subunit [Chordicoccus sp.]|jgi:exodeoxyribonuclease VII small subunit
MENKIQKDGGNTEQLTVEESFEKLDAMVKRLESEDVPLEESFRLYQEGMKLLKDVSSRIMTYEKKMQVLSGDGTMEDLD